MKRKYQVLALIVTFLFSGVLYFGVFQNPNFDFNDFCMGLAQNSSVPLLPLFY